MLPPFRRLAVRLQAVAHRPQHPRHRPPAHLVPPPPQRVRQLLRAQARPQQRPLGVAPRRRVHQPLQVRGQAGVPLRQPLPAAARRARPPSRPNAPGAARLDLPNARRDPLPRHPGRFHHPRHAAAPQRPRLRRRPYPPRPLVQQRLQRHVLLKYRRHRPVFHDLASSSSKPPLIIAFVLSRILTSRIFADDQVIAIFRRSPNLLIVPGDFEKAITKGELHPKARSSSFLHPTGR